MKSRESRLLLLGWLCIASLSACRQTTPVPAPATSAAAPAIFVPGPAAAITRSPAAAFRVLSWNVSGSHFTEHASEYRKILRLLDPDILLLDEIEGGRTPDDVAAAVRGLRGPTDTTWHVMIGGSGGRQRAAVLSRSPVSPVPKFARLPYPSGALAQIRSLMDEPTWIRNRPNLDDGIAAVAGLIELGGRRILAVALDLQSGAGTPDWQEARRIIEVREIQQALQRALQATKIDGVLVAGDFNAVSTGMPLVRITNPYPEPHVAIVPAQVFHLDAVESWTWDGRGTPFPSQALDFSLYSPDSLAPVNALAFTTEDLSPAALTAADLQAGTSRLASDHLPIVVDYRWRE
jgi:endonuclease/exonuclease/phosphatase (EEP) superfamily protein YafD